MKIPILTWLLVFSYINYSIRQDENVKGFVNTEMPVGLKLFIDLRLFLFFAAYFLCCLFTEKNMPQANNVQHKSIRVKMPQGPSLASGSVLSLWLPVLLAFCYLNDTTTRTGKVTPAFDLGRPVLLQAYQ